jgi:hypothetical protein
MNDLPSARRELVYVPRANVILSIIPSFSFIYPLVSTFFCCRDFHYDGAIVLDEVLNDVDFHFMLLLRVNSVSLSIRESTGLVRDNQFSLVDAFH